MEKGDLMSALNEVKNCLSQTTEHGKGSPPQVLIETILSISQQDDCLSPHQAELKELSLRNSVIMILESELKELKQIEIHGDELNQYIECCKWVVRLGRVLTSREVA